MVDNAYLYPLLRIELWLSLDFLMRNNVQCHLRKNMSKEAATDKLFPYS